MLVANNNYEILDNNQQDEYNIVLKASNGDKIALEYIITKYKNFVKAKAKSYFLVGADKDDIIQEGMIGLYKAVEILMEVKPIHLNVLLKFVLQDR